MPLTDTIDGVRSSSQIIQPVASPGFLGGLAQAGTRLINAMDDRSTYQANKAKSDAAASKLKAENDASFRAVQKEVGIPDTLIFGLDKLEQYKKAVANGTVPGSAFDLAGRSLMLKTMMDYPENAAAVAEMMKARNVETIESREILNKVAIANQTEANDATFKQQERQTDIKAGRLVAGPSADLMSEDALAKAGLAARQAQEAIAMHSREVASRLQDLNLNKATKEEQDVIAAESFSKFSGTYLNNNLSAGQTTFTAVMSDPTVNDAQRREAAQHFKTGAATILTQGRTWIQSSDMSAKDKETQLANLTATIENANKWADNLATGSTSEYMNNKAAYDNMIAVTRLDQQRAMPMWHAMKDIYGNNLQMVIGQMMSLPPETKALIQKEMNGYDPSNPNASAVVKRMNEIMSGKTQLDQVDPHELRGVVRTMVPIINEFSKNAPIDDKHANAFIKAMDVGIHAISGLGPAPISRDITQGVQFTFNPVSTKALKELVLKGNSDAKQTLASARNAATQYMTYGTNPTYLKLGTDPSGAWSVSYNNTLSKWEVNLDRTAWARYSKSGFETSTLNLAGAGFGAPIRQQLTYEQALRTKPKELLDRAQTLNNVNRFLTDTHVLDSNVPQGASEKTIAQWYATNGRSELVKPGTNEVIQTKSNLTRLEEWSQQNAEAGLQVQSQAELKQFAYEEGAKQGVPEGVVNALIGMESNWDPNTQGTQIMGKDGKPASRAYGMGQFIPSTAREMGLMGDGFDYRGDPMKAIPAAIKYLASRPGKNWIEKLHSYGTLARSNFKSDAEYQAAVAKAQALIGDG